MEVFALDPNGVKFLVRDLDSAFVASGVQCRFDFQAGLGGGAANQFHDQVVADQRPATPVLRHMAEETMLDFVPLAGAGWKVAHM